MNVLLIGSGGREHALAWAMKRSPLIAKLYCAPGNGGIAELAQCVDIPVADHTSVIRFCKDNAIDLVVVGPEAPLVAGIVDDLTTAGIKCFGPSQAAARLEASKGYAKDLAESIRERATPRADLAPFPIEAAEGEHTTHFSTIDQNGNAVALTYTLEESYGAKCMVAGAGFLLTRDRALLELKGPFRILTPEAFALERTSASSDLP